MPASFEDTLRTLGASRANVQGRSKLETVVTALRDADVLKGGLLSQANGLLKFRNDSLHADWQQVSQSQVESCLAFVEQLLRDHFS